MFSIQQKKVTVIGGQKSGLAALELIRRQGGQPRLSEMKRAADFPAEAVRTLKDSGAIVEWGGHTAEFVTSSDLVVLSPGVRIDAAPVVWARQAGIPVLGEIEFAYQFCRRR
ncbi:MAG: hypothetical protein HQL23_07830 [Candidatus Omnitrophica bacterium]|nr:hypothetical protein [Candidatus Omnitrophota bacterium]